jgi:asparagine N-glycosylation enzyme membrane subunit Stt3
MAKKKESEEIKDFLKSSFSNPKVQWALTLIFLLIVISVSANIRLSNLDKLVDSTTGENIPLALDPFYWMRIGQTMLSEGGLPDYDSMRFYPGGETAWSPEIMPAVNVAMYKFVSSFLDVSFEFIHVISPVIYYILGMLVFFGLVWVITRKKFFALIASVFLAFNPAYLYRTMAGFADHESIGMLAFFIALLVYSLALYYIDHKKGKVWKTVAWGAGVGLTTALTIASWGGVANFLFIIVPLSFFLVYLFNIKSKDKLFIRKGLVFYSIWILATVIFGGLFGKGLMTTFGYFMNSRNIVSLAIFGFLVIDALLINFPVKKLKTNN